MDRNRTGTWHATGKGRHDQTSSLSLAFAASKSLPSFSVLDREWKGKSNMARTILPYQYVCVCSLSVRG